MDARGKKRQVGKRKFTSVHILLFCVLIPVAGFLYAASAIRIEDAYIRVAAQGMSSAGYFKITNSSDTPDTLYAVKASFAKMAQLHESFRKNGMVGMKEIRFVVIPADSTVTFKPGGYHLMLMNVEYDLKVGMKLHVFLMFRKAGEIGLDIPVK